MGIQEISFSQINVTVRLDSGKTLYFLVWDLTPERHEKLKLQMQTALSICTDFDEIETHLKINGFEAELEDIE